MTQIEDLLRVFGEDKHYRIVMRDRTQVRSFFV